MMKPDVTGLQLWLDALGQAVLVFDADGHLSAANAAARTLLNADLRLIESDGWRAVTALLDSPHSSRGLEDATAEALATGQPARFQVYLRGEYHTCWAAVVRHGDRTATVVSIELPDWGVMADLMDQFVGELRTTVEATRGHTELIAQTLKHAGPDATAGYLNRRISGFTRLIDAHMHRSERLLELMSRLQAIRLGRLRPRLEAERRRIRAGEFLEDLVESLDDTRLLDPETDEQDLRSRIRLDIPADAEISASPEALATVLRELIRNAMMYSMRATPVVLRCRPTGRQVQIDVSDEGYGIRASEYERVFAPFQRARQPQILGEFGYGLGLYLCKHEVEAMNGRLWFQSDEGAGTTFSLKLPVWQADYSDARGSGSVSSDKR